MPDECISNCRSVTSFACGAFGTYVASESSSLSRPPSTSCKTETAVKIFVMEPARKRVAAVAAVFLAMSLVPAARAYTIAPFSTTATEIARALAEPPSVPAASAASRRDVRAGVSASGSPAGAACAAVASVAMHAKASEPLRHARPSTARRALR